MRFFLVAALTACLMFSCTTPESRQDQSEDIAANNRGVGLMGSFDYSGAHEVFGTLSAKKPDWLELKINLAIATLNLQTETSEDEALALLDEVLAVEPDNLRARFCSGLLLLYRGETATAMEQFRFVVEKDTADAYAAYYLGQCLARDGEYEKAGAYYQQAIDRDPYLRSAYYGLFQAYQRQRKRDEARAMLGVFQKLEGNPQARQAEFKYTRMGPKADAMVIDDPNRETPATPQGPLFAEPENLPLPAGAAWNTPTAERPRSITTCDIDGDGRVDLFLAGALRMGDEVRNAVYLSTDNGFNPQPDHPFAAVTGVNAVLWGDYDNDGLVDVYFCREGVNALWRQESAGTWSDVTQSTQTGGPDAPTSGGLWLDADHDGDLDLFTLQNGANQLMNNNADGTFRMLAEERGIAGTGASQSLVAADLDHDRDLDLLVVNGSDAHEAWANNRLWDYQAASGFQQFLQTPISAVVASDVDVDGQVELYTLGNDGQINAWQPDESGTWMQASLTSGASGNLAVTDFDGNGVPELAHGSASGWTVTDLKGDKLFEQPGALPHSWSTLVLGDNSGPLILATGTDGSALLSKAGPGRHPFLSLRFSGKEDKGNSMRSNWSGIGTRYAARTGSNWSAGDTFPTHAGPGQSLGPVSLGIGKAPRLDFLAVWWSDGVFQTELDLENGTHHAIEETQRQLSSCPVLFVWDGEEYRFVSDLLGVGGMGYALGPDQYSTPRPWENFQLPEGLMKAHNGQFSIRITEPMEEACYLDYVGLASYDLPPGWEMVLDERMATGGPEVTGEPRFYRQSYLPRAARNERGQDVLAAITTRDNKAAPIPERDQRFIGILGSEHVLTLDFQRPLEGDNLMLVADGWVEYPYSQTNFAAWQAGVACQPPTLEVQDTSGTWQVVMPQFGYPAGMPRRMSVPLPQLPANNGVIRLRTNQEIYWDRIILARSEDCPDAVRTDYPLERAELSDLGFAKRTDFDQRRPHYDMNLNAPLWDTRHQAGFYTETGEMTPLVVNQDDALAIFGPGEGVTFWYQDKGLASKNGWSRVYFLETAGWCKDMDLYTRTGETIAPLPVSGKPPEERDKLNSRFNTRYRSGY